MRFLWFNTLKALANEDTMLRTHCCRHKCFPVCPRAQHLLRTLFCVRDTIMFLILFRNISCPQQMFPSLRAQGNVMIPCIRVSCELPTVRYRHTPEMAINLSMHFMTNWCIILYLHKSHNTPLSPSPSPKFSI